MPRNSQRKAAVSNRPRGGAKPQMNMIRPPKFDSTVRFKHRFRYVSTGSNVTITRANLLNLLLSPSSTTAGNRIFSGIKLNRIEAWAVEGSGTGTGNMFGPATITVEWLATLSPTTEVSDTGNCFNTAHLIATPPPLSTCAFWTTTGNNESDDLFTIVCPVGTIVDIFVDCVLMDGETPVSVTISGGTTGMLVAFPLDGSTGSFTPVAYSNVVS